MNIAVVAVIIFLASVIQSSVGFGYALFSTPLLIWMAMPLPHAITTVAVCSFVQSVLGTRDLRASVPWRLSLTAVVVRVVTIIGGLLILRSVVGLDPGIVRLVVGCILCILVVIQLVYNVRPSEAVHWFWSGLAFSASGLLSGVCGMGGPPLVLWSVAHNWPTEKTRGFLFSVFVGSIPVQIVLLYVTFGAEIPRVAGTALLFVPVIFLGAAVGLPLGRRIPKRTLRKIVHLLLLCIGLSSIIPALIG